MSLAIQPGLAEAHNEKNSSIEVIYESDSLDSTYEHSER